MAILAESYSAEYLLRHLEGKRMEWQREQQVLKRKLEDANNAIRYEDRIIKINNVLSTSPKYIEKYEALQEVLGEAKAMKEKIDKVSEAINKLVDTRSDEKFKGEFAETVIHLSLSDRIAYDLSEGSDLNAV